jgi:hypothetical protein
MVISWRGTTVPSDYLITSINVDLPDVFIYHPAIKYRTIKTILRCDKSAAFFGIHCLFASWKHIKGHIVAKHS